jgi:hypothetical protein
MNCKRYEFKCKVLILECDWMNRGESWETLVRIGMSGLRFEPDYLSSAKECYSLNGNTQIDVGPCLAKESCIYSGKNYGLPPVQIRISEIVTQLLMKIYSNVFASQLHAYCTLSANTSILVWD